jgi:uncharacterized UPF0160 family protein
MSGHHFHVHGPHDHAVEHASHGGDRFASRIAAMTAVLSTVGAIFSYYGGATQNDALMYKNEAAIKKTEASDQWSFYQAKSNKQNLAEVAAVLATGEARERYAKEVERYKTEKDGIKAKAEGLEAASREAEHKSEGAMHLHHRWAQAMTAIQVAISLAAITLLSRRRWLQHAAWGTAVVGVVLAGMALAHL